MKNKELNVIGLPNEYTDKVSVLMNNLLADYTMYYHNLRGFHWNIRGHHFFSLHEKFEELYLDAAEAIDEIAERILTLGKTPLHTLTDYMEHAEINSEKNVSREEDAVEAITRNLSILLMNERKVLKTANEFEDEGTADMMTALINKKEKVHWMMRAWLQDDKVAKKEFVQA